MLIFILWFLVATLIIGLIIGMFKAFANASAAASAKNEPVHATIIDLRRGALSTTVIFELAEGNRVPLAVPEKDVSTLMVGDSGLLTYHKTVFKSFTR